MADRRKSIASIGSLPVLLACLLLGASPVALQEPVLRLDRELRIGSIDREPYALSNFIAFALLDAGWSVPRHLRPGHPPG